VLRQTTAAEADAVRTRGEEQTRNARCFRPNNPVVLRQDTSIRARPGPRTEGAITA
jgi:hypothetical protein